MRITPLNAPFGAAIEGIDCAAVLDDATMRQLVATLHEHRLIVLKGQNFEHASYLAFGERWGTPIPHVLDHLRMPGFPGMMAIGNTEKKDREDNVRNGAAFWHTDQSYEAEPSSATMLHAIKVPKRGGETQLADMTAAYDALSEAMKARLEGLNAMHLYGAASGRDGELKAAWFKSEEQSSRVPAVKHPIARRHPVTGRTVLYAVAGTPIAVEGLEQEESDALLAELKAHALQERFIYRHRYEPGDVAIYDTVQTLHSGVPIDVADGAGSERLLWRISVRGLPGVCRGAEAA